MQRQQAVLLISSLHHLLDDLFQVLVVSVVAWSPQDRVVIYLQHKCRLNRFSLYVSTCVLVRCGRHLHETRNVSEPSQRAVWAQHVGRNDNAAIKLYTKHRRSGHHRVTVERKKKYHSVIIHVKKYIVITRLNKSHWLESNNFAQMNWIHQNFTG